MSSLIFCLDLWVYGTPWLWRFLMVFYIIQTVILSVDVYYQLVATLFFGCLLLKVNKKSNLQQGLPFLMGFYSRSMFPALSCSRGTHNTHFHCRIQAKVHHGCKAVLRSYQFLKQYYTIVPKGRFVLPIYNASYCCVLIPNWSLQALSLLISDRRISALVKFQELSQEQSSFLYSC